MIRLFALLILASSVLAAEKPPALAFVDPATKRAFFTIDDIQRFDWEQQVLELKPERAIEVELWLVRQLNRDFAVQVEGQTAYEGIIVSPVSSRSHARPAIIPDDFEHKLPLLRIARTYAAPEQGPDPRVDERVKKALAEAKLLGAIDPAKPPAEIRKISSEWSGELEFKVRATLFPDTFRPEGEGRVHVFFHTDSRTPVEADVARVQVQVIGGDGKFGVTSSADLAMDQVREQGYHAVSLDLRRSREGGELSAGAASVNVSVSLHKEKAALRTVALPPIKIEVAKAK